jgi:hypothetical protein
MSLCLNRSGMGPGSALRCARDDAAAVAFKEQAQARHGLPKPSFRGYTEKTGGLETRAGASPFQFAAVRAGVRRAAGLGSPVPINFGFGLRAGIVEVTMPCGVSRP